MTKKLESTYGYKAAVLKELSEDPRLEGLIPHMVFIPDTVFREFVSDNSGFQNRMDAWQTAIKEKNYDQGGEEIEKIRGMIKRDFPDYMRYKIPDLVFNIQREIGSGKKLIVRSSGLEDLEGCINAGGNQSIPNVDVENIYEGIAEVIASYFSEQTLSVLENNPDRMNEFKCPVLIQEMAGTIQKGNCLDDYPVLDQGLIRTITELVIYLEEKFQKPVDTEWVVTQGDETASLVGFSRDPGFHSESVYLSCSMGVGSAVRKTAIMNSTHYLICRDEKDCLYLESPEKNTQPCHFSEAKAELKLVQCRPAVMNKRKLWKNKDSRYLADSEKGYEISTIIVGKGDADGKFLINETISEAWEEYITSENRQEYAGCIVRAGSVLEHAGIMFTEREIPVVQIDDEAFAEIAVSENRDFVLCQVDVHLLFHKKDGADMEYEQTENADVILPFKQAFIHSMQGSGRLCGMPDQTGTAKNLERIFEYYLEFTEIVKKDPPLLIDVMKMERKLEYLPTFPGERYERACSLIRNILRAFRINLERKDNSALLLWRKIAAMYMGNRLFLVLGNESFSMEEALIDAAADLIRTYSDEIKIDLLKKLDDNLTAALKKEWEEAVLFSLGNNASEKLPQKYRKQYEKYRFFRERLRFQPDEYHDVKRILELYRKESGNEKTDHILELIFQGERSTGTAAVYLEMLKQNVPEMQEFRETINGLLVEPWIDRNNIRQYILALNIVFHYAGVGDMTVCAENWVKADELVRWFGKLQMGEICQNIETIFTKHEEGILDQDLEIIGKARHILQNDWLWLKQMQIDNNCVFYPVYSNVMTNMVNAIIDLYDIEGKSYANSLAMGIYSIYPNYLAHLERWNSFLKNELSSGQDEYKQTPDIIERKLELLKKIPNYHVTIQVENMWYEKISMDIDFNLHEIHNILHQASISFAAERYRFAPSECVKKLHKRFLTFDLHNRRILRNQNKCIEIELGLGNYKLHKSSIMIRPDRISAQYVEAPFISIGRIVVLQQMFEMLREKYTQYRIVTRLQKRNGDHLLLVHFMKKDGAFNPGNTEFAAEIICALFDSFELGGGLTEEEAQIFIEIFKTEKFAYFLDCMIHFHERLQYSECMGGGLEENDKCIYQSLLALMVIFPERFEFLNTVTTYNETLKRMKQNLEKTEWKTDKYKLKEGWLKKAYSLCLAILYPRKLRKSLNQGKEWAVPDSELCNLYLKMIRY